MFTEENNEYWRKFSRLINSGFEERKYWHSAKALYVYMDYLIVFDNYTFTAVADKYSLENFVTRICCRVASKEDLTFKIIPKNFSNRILNLFCKKQIISDRGFDEKFLFIFQLMKKFPGYFLHHYFDSFHRSAVLKQVLVRIREFGEKNSTRAVLKCLFR